MSHVDFRERVYYTGRLACAKVLCGGSPKSKNSKGSTAVGVERARVKILGEDETADKITDLWVVDVGLDTSEC